MAESPLKFVVVCLFLILALQGTRALYCPHGTKAFTYSVKCKRHVPCEPEGQLPGPPVKILAAGKLDDRCRRLRIIDLKVVGVLRKSQSTCRGYVTACFAIAARGSDGSDGSDFNGFGSDSD